MGKSHSKDRRARASIQQFQSTVKLSEIGPGLPAQESNAHKSATSTTRLKGPDWLDWKVKKGFDGFINSSQKSSQDGIVTMSGSKQLPPAHSDAVTCLAPVRPGLCLTGSSDKTVVLYDWTQGAVKRRWSGHTREVTKVAYSAGLDVAFSASRDKTVLMWKLSNIETNPIRAFRGHTMVVMGITISPDNTQVCTGSRDNSLRMWDVETGACLMENSVPRNLVSLEGFSPFFCF
ncbi:WDR31 [Branchiostoma lanceolatum]|uniref:WDR31 protein n=1 Tax=Branchiostoma lanceolatum TaxID=7740 RepID=A0A8K0EZK6_BRALA|nr:WDR31 [Branchiostoma lanceolatum]